MGNCMETCPPWPQEGIQERGINGGGVGEDGDGLDKAKAGAGGVLKVKLVLTRRELEWLMLQLKDKRERRLHDLVTEMGRERRESMMVHRWTPNLASIMESPELQSFETTT
ncbi:hypothetical protein J5N97_007698 [Dioscorea zingiberensis]|uniref:Uncharacterized protein n=1 Tax=Dioscorea zingiberensis TaxID=325984 RepID=A0A9D5HVU2_9LILI|nr:hypothetical protein J5N97_007698 [Dioscorea zingiberensis]